MKFPAKEEDRDSPSQDETNRHATDQRIRRHGFRIHGRPKRGEATWEKGGVVYGETEVLEWIEPKVKAA